MRFDVFDFISDLLDIGIEFFLLRPVESVIHSGDVDIVIYEDQIKKFELYLNDKYQCYKKFNNRYAFRTTEYIIGNIAIDVKTSLCFGERKEIYSSYRPKTSSIEILDGYIYPTKNDSFESFIIIWLLHLVLDKKKPSDSSTYSLFKEYVPIAPEHLSLINKLSILKPNMLIKDRKDLDLSKLKANLNENMKRPYNILRSESMVFIFRCYFYLRRRL